MYDLIHSVLIQIRTTTRNLILYIDFVYRSVLYVTICALDHYSPLSDRYRLVGQFVDILSHFYVLV